ncbi:hypothetical protein K144316041_16430 [Clostridium tetani]|uniref:Diguanylate cyclase n=1 Tax=Clostridium tetani TaxID=1513 RepID=A0ABC8ECV4_CLOTA|nr:sensor domain-containing diguanylate cyclase [Clostridium tetani]RXM69104.1 hypothetical protein DP139_10765 [Clostridium tetani]BDR67545.1 hypothetical protein K144312032_17730 [Clostridium tetani]BDR72935.1 hypothetical protein K144316041_16430 [Clostridium tetani]BDR81478.1 hypothetical protein K234311028_17240 [Clostridium tetani]BDR89858.1 hypothetical protein N072000002_16590 [Clostridium tetani]
MYLKFCYLFIICISSLICFFFFFYVRKLRVGKKFNDDLIKQYRSILSNIPATIIRIKVEECKEIKIKYISSSCEKILGISSEEIIGNSSLIFGRIYYEDLVNYEIFIRELINSENSLQAVTRITMEEQVKWIQCNLTLEKNNKEKIWDGIIVDITSQKKAEEEIRDLNKELKELSMELHKMSYLDSLTGMYNRRKIMQLGNGLIIKAKICRSPYFVAMMDVDDFKEINDTYGHALGDKALLVISQICVDNLKGKCNFGRLGGEEFIFIVTEKDKKEVMELMNELRKEISKEVIEKPIRNIKRNIKITVSIGVTDLKDQDESLEDIIQRADEALYLAKRNGKNKVISI